MSRLDVVIFGATGYTGKHAVAEMARIAHERGLSWGVAGRSQGKLQEMLKEISKNTGKDISGIRIIQADATDEKTLEAMCDQTRVLINCCGSYALHGELVLRTAILCRTHYVDCCADPYFLELMQLQYDQDARKAGVYVVNACGFGSIPTDLGVLFLQKNFGGILNSVECYMSLDNHYNTINEASWHSFIYGLPFYFKLSVNRKKIYPTSLPRRTPKLKRRFLIHKRFGGWCLWLPGNDSSAVYRTQRYFYEREGRRPVQIKTYIKFESLLNTMLVVAGLIFMFLMSHLKLTRDFLLKHPRILSCGIVTNGPSQEVIRNKGYVFKLVGIGWDKSEVDYVDISPPKKSMTALIFGKNPGYGLTGIGMIYSAVAILEEPDQMPPEFGVLTPGIAFSKTKLLKHLQENGVNLKIVIHKE